MKWVAVVPLTTRPFELVSPPFDAEDVDEALRLARLKADELIRETARHYDETPAEGTVRALRAGVQVRAAA